MKSILFLVLIGLVWPSYLLALPNFERTPEEDAMCKIYLREYDVSKIPNVRDRGHMHHYCDCLRFTNRAHKFPRSDKRFTNNINEALDGCNYVIKKVSEQFYMLPDVYVARGKAHAAAKKDSLALQDFLKALQLNQGFEPAYIELIKYYRKAGDKKTALMYATEGLKHNPDSRPLKRRLERLGGTAGSDKDDE